MIRSTGPLYVFILSALAPDPLPIKIQPVLVGKATYIGSSMKLTKSIPKQLLVCAHQTIAPLCSLDKPAVYAFG